MYRDYRFPQNSGPHSQAKTLSALTSMQDLNYCEFFAGAGNCFRAVRGASYASVAVDITYIQHTSRNSMDILSDSGLAWEPQLNHNKEGADDCTCILIQIYRGIWLIPV